MSDTDIISALGERAASRDPAAGFTSGSDSDGTFGNLLKDVKSLLDIKAPQPKVSDAVANDVAQISRGGLGAAAGRLAEQRLEAGRAAEASRKGSAPTSLGVQPKQQVKRDRVPISDDDMTVTSSDGGGSSESPTPKASLSLERPRAQSLDRKQAQDVKEKMGATDPSGPAQPHLQRRATTDVSSLSAQFAKEPAREPLQRRVTAPVLADPLDVPAPLPKTPAVPTAKDKAAPPPPEGLRDGLRTQHICMLCALQVLSPGELNVLLSQWQQEWLHTSGRATDAAVQAAIATKEANIARKEERRARQKQKGARQSTKHAERNANHIVPSNSGLPSPATVSPDAAVSSTHGRLAEWRGSFR